VGYAQWAWMHKTMAVAMPYLRWLDYCELGFVVPASLAVNNMEAVRHSYVHTILFTPHIHCSHLPVNTAMFTPTY
jgi:hypothetical protein